MSNKVRLGYIGLGNMGSPMATKMTEWPGGITVYDIRTEAMTPLAEKGASLADSVADVAVADIIHITVLDDAQVREVVRELCVEPAVDSVSEGAVVPIGERVGVELRLDARGARQSWGTQQAKPRAARGWWDRGDAGGDDGLPGQAGGGVGAAVAFMLDESRYVHGEAGG